MESNWKYFRTVFFLIIVSWSITAILGPMVREIAVDLRVESEAQIGFITSIFLIIASLLSFLWAFLEDRFSRKYLLILAGILNFFAILLISFSNTYFDLFLFHIIAAIGYSAIFPIGCSLTMDYIVPEERAKAFSLLSIARTIGIGLSYILSGLLVDQSWKLPFLIISILGFVNIIFLFKMEDPKKGSRERELSLVLSEGLIYNYHIKGEDIKVLVKNKSSLLIFMFNFFLVLGTGSIYYYLITMLKSDHNFSSIAATLFVVATYSDGMFGNLLWGKRADKKFTERLDGKAHVLLESLILAPPFLIVAYSINFSVSQLELVFIFAILTATGVFLAAGLISISNSILGDINPPELRATAFSMNNFSQTIGRSIGIALMGIFFNMFGGTIYLGFGIFINLFGEGYRWGFIIMNLLYFIGLVFIIPLKKILPNEINKLNNLLKKRAKQLDEKSKLNN
ncbi:MAG: MFS transporter [Candidatus Hodarchaeota archaeon]